MTSLDFMQVMLALIAGLLSILGTAFGWWLSKLSAKVDALMQIRQDCITRFADKARNSEDHRRLWTRVDDLDRRITTVEAIKK